MNLRSFAATLCAASFVVIAAAGHAQPTPAPLAAPAVAPAPLMAPNTCVKPEYPGKTAAQQRFNAFNRDYTAYGECVKKYVEDTKVIMNAAIAAVNGAVEDFNKYTADIHALDGSTSSPADHPAEKSTKY
jgi:hypothetical protein